MIGDPSETYMPDWRPQNAHPGPIGDLDTPHRRPICLFGDQNAWSEMFFVKIQCSHEQIKQLLKNINSQHREALTPCVGPNMSPIDAWFIVVD